MSCRIDVTLCKTVDEKKLKGFDFTPFLSNVWAPSTIYELDDRVRPKRPNGFQYRATVGGQTGATAPNFPAREGAVVTDGTVGWEAELIDNASLRATINSSAWSANDPSVSFTDEAIDNTGGRQRTSANIGGGVAGATYTIINTVTMSDGEVEEMGISLEVSA